MQGACGVHRWAHRVGMEGGLQGSTWGAHRGPGGVPGHGVRSVREASVLTCRVWVAGWGAEDAANFGFGPGGWRPEAGTGQSRVEGKEAASGC